MTLDVIIAHEHNSFHISCQVLVVKSRFGLLLE